MESPNLFVYGELRRAEVLRRLLGRLPDAEPAVVIDHHRRRDPQTGYFRVTPAAEARVAGLLLRGIDDEELGRIDAYEGPGYRRSLVEAFPEGLAAGKVQAWIYLASTREAER